MEGVRCNRSAVGARIRVTISTPEGNREIHATVGTGGSFGSSSLQQEIGLGNAVALESIQIRWPGDPTPQLFRGVPMDRVVKLRQGDPAARVVSRKRIRLSGQRTAGPQTPGP